jgi:O-antigen ligase
MAAGLQTPIREGPPTLRSTRPLVSASIPPGPLITAAVLCAAGIGLALALNLPIGLALVAVACFVTVATVNLPIGVALWTPFMFLQAVPALNLAGKAAGGALALIWLGTLRGRNRWSLWAVARHRRLLGILVLLLTWFSLSLLWAPVPDAVLDVIWRWYLLGILFVVLMSSVSSVAAIRLLIWAFLAGAAISLLTGVLTTGFPSQGARLEGAQGDPNILAASLVAGIVLAAALASQTRRSLVRWLLMTSVIWMLIGFAATESRGGLIAAVVTVVAAFVFLAPQRRYVGRLALVTTLVLAGFFLASPTVWQRVTASDGGSGRTDIWTVATRIAKQRPIAGTGLNNFTHVEGNYVREPGALTRVDLIVDRPRYVHNMYLELLAETGVVGLSLFLLFAGCCLRAGWLAGRRFEARGQPAAAILARSVLVATIGMLGASIFLSTQADLRLWFLFALGPACLLLAERQRDLDPPRR